MSETPRTYTIAEAAAVTGLTVKALRNRCDRGQLRFLVKGGVRRIPLVELRRAGILNDGQELELEDAPAGEARELVNRELLAELAKAHERIGELQALEERSSSTERELEDARRALEAERATADKETRRALDAERELERLRGRGLLSRLRNQ